MPVSKDLQHFLSHLSAAPRVPRPDNEDWKALINRISVPGTIAEVDKETYWYFLEVLPPNYLRGSAFALAEGQDALRLFWRDRDGHYWVRQLTWEETVTFCRLADIPLPS